MDGGGRQTDRKATSFREGTAPEEELCALGFKGLWEQPWASPDGSQAAGRQAHSSHFGGAAGIPVFQSLFAVLLQSRAHTGLRMG